jgi:large subunit ribosomal protein L6
VSRVGKLPVVVPGSVKVVLEQEEIRVEGPKGKLTSKLPAQLSVEIEAERLHVRRQDDTAKSRALHGLTRKLVANMVEGVSEGFKRVLEINGIGYRAELKGQELHLTLGYSHPVVFPLPKGVSASVDRQTVITLECHDKQLLGQTAAVIREFRPPEPYKGKGIRYQGEVVRRKAGKAIGAAGS